jgi:hypothetical protein
METTEAKTSTCPKCGSTFTCDHGGKCWCSEIKLSQETLDYLVKTYKGCLCPECLKTFQVFPDGMPLAETWKV